MVMSRTELCAWLRANSSGIYRPAADAADDIEQLAEAAAGHFQHAMLNGKAVLAALHQCDALRRALEIIAVGDAENQKAQAAEELIALGYWRDIPEARTPTAVPVVGAA